jgi:hypothetical protein
MRYADFSRNLAQQKRNRLQVKQEGCYNEAAISFRCLMYLPTGFSLGPTSTQVVGTAMIE